MKMRRSVTIVLAATLLGAAAVLAGILYESRRPAASGAMNPSWREEPTTSPLQWLVDSPARGQLRKLDHAPGRWPVHPEATPLHAMVYPDGTELAVYTFSRKADPEELLTFYAQAAQRRGVRDMVRDERSLRFGHGDAAALVYVRQLRGEVRLTLIVRYTKSAR